MSTKIDYVDEVWNPVIGCSKCSPGCKNCYAEKMATRQVSMGFKRHLKDPDGDESAWIAYSGTIDPNTGKWNGDVELRYDQLDKPLHWRQPRKILTCSMGDLFHEKVPFEFIDRVFDVIEQCSQHTFQILTKRPEKMLNSYWRYTDNIEAGISEFVWPENCWFGVSISTQEDLWMADVLRQIPAAVRFISFEPLLADLGKLDLSGIHWGVIGKETGPKARPCELEWIHNIVEQCKQAGVPVFVKKPDIGVREFPKGK